MYLSIIISIIAIHNLVHMTFQESLLGQTKLSEIMKHTNPFSFYSKLEINTQSTNNRTGCHTTYRVMTKGIKLHSDRVT